MNYRLLMFLFISAPLGAQSAPPVSTGQAVASARANWAQVTEYITMAAEQMPGKKYAFRPSPKVRTFGQLIGHVAGAQHMICASALGEPQRSEDNIEKNVTTKSGLIAALKSSTEYCNRAYALTDAQADAETTIFGQKRPRIYSLIMNASHNAEHYGNLVTYLRINDMVPPSSQPAPPRQ